MKRKNRCTVPTDRPCHCRLECWGGEGMGANVTFAVDRLQNLIDQSLVLSASRAWSEGSLYCCFIAYQSILLCHQQAFYCWAITPISQQGSLGFHLISLGISGKCSLAASYQSTSFDQNPPLPPRLYPHLPHGIVSI